LQNIHIHLAYFKNQSTNNAII